MRGLLEKKNERDLMEDILDRFDLNVVLDRQVEELSGGELQRFACAIVCVQLADVYVKNVY